MEEELVAHHGKGVKHFRRTDYMSVEQLASQLGITPSRLEDLEQEPLWEDEMLHKASIALNVPLGMLQMYYPEIFEKSAPTIITNNTFNDESSMSKGQGSQIAGSIKELEVTNNNTLDKIVDLYHDQVADLKETIAALRKEIADLKKK